MESMDKMFGPALDPVPITMHGAPSAEEGQQLPCPLTSIDVYVPTLFGDGFVDDIVKLNIFVLPGLDLSFSCLLHLQLTLLKETLLRHSRAYPVDLL